MSEDKSDIVGISRLDGKKETEGANQNSGGSLIPDPPVTPTEKKLHEIWGSILGQKQIRREDNFIVLGGDSLSLAQVITEVENAFHVLLPIEVVANNLTLKSMAEAIDQML